MEGEDGANTDPAWTDRQRLPTSTEPQGKGEGRGTSQKWFATPEHDMFLPPSQATAPHQSDR